MHRIFKKKEILTIPNLLSLFRLALIPLIIWLYCGAKNYYAAIGVIIISGASDIIDGIIARKFNMISDFGKILDPIADKLTQTALLFCLLTKYPLMLGLIVVFGVCELTKLALGAAVMKKHDEVNSAKWYGKLNTVVIYGVMILLIMFPNMDVAWANALIVGCGIVMIVAHILYAQFYYFILRKSKVNKGNKKEYKTAIITMFLEEKILKEYRAGIDVGSTTVKLVVLDENDHITYGKYRRHLAHTQATLTKLLKEAKQLLGECKLRVRITGSGSINLGKALNIDREL